MTIKRPGLYAIKAILSTVDKFPEHNAKYSDLVRATSGVRNRKEMLDYLDLLTEDLGWLKRFEITKHSFSAGIHHRTKVKVTYYSLTEKGKSFLSLFSTTKESE